MCLDRRRRPISICQATTCWTWSPWSRSTWSWTTRTTFLFSIGSTTPSKRSSFCQERLCIIRVSCVPAKYCQHGRPQMTWLSVFMEAYTHFTACSSTPPPPRTPLPLFTAVWCLLNRPLQYHKKWVNGPSYKSWKLNVPILANCYRLAGQLMSDLLDK